MLPLYINWTDGQKDLYRLQQLSSHVFGIIALGAITTNYAGMLRRLDMALPHLRIDSQLTSSRSLPQCPNGS